MAPHDLQAIAFPRLDEAQITALARSTEAALQKYAAGHVLFRVGERDFKFFIVRSGELEILDESGETPKTVTIHRPGDSPATSAT